MKVGSYGNIVFTVSDTTAEIFQNLKFSKAATYSEHEVHGQKAVREFTGFPSDSASFELVLSAFHGVNPKNELKKLEDMLKSKKAYSLVLGTDLYGVWVLESIGNNVDYTWKDGSLLQCTVSVTMYEGATS